MTLDALLAEAAEQLRRAGIDTSALDARLLLQYCSGLSRTELLLRGTSSAEASLLACYRDLVHKRTGRTPLHYLLGSKEFWSLNFQITPAVLVPRQETEFLLEQVLGIYQGQNRPKCALDLCTGSGVIAIVLALELGCPIFATDISASALEVAAINCRQHSVEPLVSLHHGDLFTVFAHQEGIKFDLIVSNPPYVADAEIDTLEPEVALAEPRLALAGGPSGCDMLARIAREAPAFLQPDGLLFVEIGADQEAAVLKLFSTPDYADVEVLPDWSGRARVLRAHAAPLFLD